MSAVKKAAIVAVLCGLIAGLLGCRERAPKTAIANVFPLTVYADTVTGCQYVTEGSGLTPRIAADGHSHMGCSGGAK